MNVRALVLVLSALTLLAALLWWRSPDRAPQAVNESLLDRAVADKPALERATAIEIEAIDDEQTTIVHRTRLEKDAAGLWRLSGYHGLRAEPKKVADLFRDMLEARVVRVAANRAAAPAEFGLGAQRVTLLDRAGAPLVRIVFGREVSPFHFFAQVDDRPEVYLLKHNVFVDAVTPNWPDRWLLPFKPEEVASVRVRDEAGAEATFFRGKAETPWEALEARPDVQVNSLAVGRLLSELSDAAYVDPMPLGDPAVAAARGDIVRELTFETFQGGRTTVRIGLLPGAREARAAEKAAEAPAKAPRALLFIESVPEDARLREMSAVGAPVYWQIDVLERWPAEIRGFFLKEGEPAVACPTCE